MEDDRYTLSDEDFLVLSTDVVSAYVANNSVAIGDLPNLIASVHEAFKGLVEAPAPVVEQKLPAVPVKKSVTPGFIICLEDGKKFKSLKRHLRTRYDMSPEEYRAKWNLPSDYPMVAPDYAASRSELAKKMGLGQQRTKAPEPAPAPAPTRGRKKAASA